MCGIVGYIGEREAAPILLKGLRRLEYRGYDSAGIAVVNGTLDVRKKLGKVDVLSGEIDTHAVLGNVGIGHTRWATHGIPSDINAHPHVSSDGVFALVHNGIIENYMALREKLERLGYKFQSQTDTEVLVRLIEEIHSSGNTSLVESVQEALRHVVGAYGIALVSAEEPDLLIAARNGSPLILGVGKNEYFLGSDASPIIEYTRDVVYLNDGEMAVVRRCGYEVLTIDNVKLDKAIDRLDWDLQEIEKGGYPHFMLKEIFEQPKSVQNAMRGRIDPANKSIRLGGLMEYIDVLREASRIVICACGTSWHAALVGEYMIEGIARIPVEVEYASEFRYRNPILRKGDVVLVISQSGETADTLAAAREAKEQGIPVFGICNTVGSTISRETDAGIYLHAGPEIGVASTKAFTGQITVLAMLAIKLGRGRALDEDLLDTYAEELLNIPAKIEEVLTQSEEISNIGQQYSYMSNFLYLGRGANFPVALEGALKLKEISYIHAEGYPAAEMKHGPIALIDQFMPVVVIAIKDSTYHKVLSNIEEVVARQGAVIAVTDADSGDLERLCKHVIRIPSTLEFLSPLLSVIPLQLLSYHIAVQRGCDVDQPRNLAKSVTVE